MINLLIAWLDTIPPSWGILIGSLTAMLVGCGAFFLAHRADARRRESHKNRNLLAGVYRVYRQYKGSEDQVMKLIRPALVHYGHLLGQREGGDFSNNLQWELDGDTVILIASEDCKDVWRLRVPTFYFDAPYDVLYVIEDMVWANQDQNDIRDEQVAILNAERAREGTGE